MDSIIETDAALLRRYASAGDADAMGELVRRYAGMVFGVAQRITSNPHDAEDVAQACFLELLANAGGIPDRGGAANTGGSAAGWMHSAAVHRALDLLRNKKTRQRHEREAAQRKREDVTADATQWWEQVAPRVDAAITELPAGLKEPLILHFLQGRTQAEVAGQLKISQPTVSRRLDEAVGELRKRLKELEAIGAAAILPALLYQHAITEAPASLTAALGKMAVAGVGTPAMTIPGAGLSTTAASATGAGVATAFGMKAVLGLLIVLGLCAALSLAVKSWIAPAGVQAQQPAPAPTNPGTAIASWATAKSQRVTVNFSVRDVPGSAKWYRERLDFTLVGAATDTLSTLKCDEATLVLRNDGAGAAKAVVAMEEREDIDDLYKQFLRHAAAGEAPAPPGKPQAGNVMYRWVVADPDGNQLTFECEK
jgi:RNA polymerase sigma factor (sigma-70 family)